MRRSASFRRGGGHGSTPVGRFVRQCPVTAGILGLSLFGFLAMFFAARMLPLDRVAFSPGRFLVSPWTAITYPFVADEQLFFYVLSLYWCWFVGRDLESSIGPSRLAALFAGTAAASAMGLLLYARLFHAPDFFVAGLYLPLSAMTVGWALRHPERVVLFSFVVPLSGNLLAIVTAAFVYLYWGPLRGLFALAGCLVAWLWVLNGRRGRFRRSSDAFARIAPERLSLLDRFRLWRARRRMKKVWDSDHPDRFVN